jgi:hypothetical protein
MDLVESDREQDFLTFGEAYGRLLRAVDPGLPAAEARIVVHLRERGQSSAELARALVMDPGQVSRSVVNQERKCVSACNRGSDSILMKLESMSG